MQYQGHCLCGEVKVTIESSNPSVHACHCTTCRRWSSSPLFAVGADSVEFSGQDHITVYDSSEWAERGFCSKCGTSLFYHLKEADHYVVCTGLFAETAFELEGEIYVDENPGGYAFAGEHPRLTGEEFLASIQGGE